MPLSDWLGRPRSEGFAEQLGLIADALRLDGEVHDGAGYYRVWGGAAHHMVTVRLEDAGVVVRAFSNVKFPPGEVPREVVAGLMRWKAAHRCFVWDAHSCEDWACALMRCAIAPTSFAAQVLASVTEDLLAEVTALDRLLVENGYGRVERVPPLRGPAVGSARPAQGRLEPPRPAQSLVQRVADAASRLLGGW